jgi:hypothetical protein
VRPVQSLLYQRGPVTHPCISRRDSRHRLVCTTPHEEHREALDTCFKRVTLVGSRRRGTGDRRITTPCFVANIWFALTQSAACRPVCVAYSTPVRRWRRGFRLSIRTTPTSGGCSEHLFIGGYMAVAEACCCCECVWRVILKVTSACAHLRTVCLTPSTIAPSTTLRQKRKP